jgi:hypothetical protein
MLAFLDAAIERLGLRSFPPFSLNAGLGLLAVGGGIVAPDLLGGTAGSLLAMQFLVLIPMTFVAALLAAAAADRQDPAQKRGHRTLILWFTTPCMLIGFLLSFQVGGIFGPLEFVALTGATYLGAIQRIHGVHEIADVGVRTAVGLVALLVAQSIGGLGSSVDSWLRDPGAVKAAAFYFSALSALEAAGFHAWAAPKVLELARRMRRTA